MTTEVPLPEIDAEFLHYNPNTNDLIEYTQTLLRQHEARVRRQITGEIEALCLPTPAHPHGLTRPQVVKVLEDYRLAASSIALGTTTKEKP